ncbi:MAG: class I SAM-dependent methyltransferase [Propionibacteriaceae bacterium]|jgi:SAM-dependent methyltransferase|nr:class I SAM-dependent methyltransferase [Propionibacteriaceae bacterium]
MTIDIPRIFSIRESGHRIHNPFTHDKLATVGQALHLIPGQQLLDLGSGSGEMLCTWARDYGISGVGVDMSIVFSNQAHARAIELNVADRLQFIQADAAGYVTHQPVDVAACLGASWIAGGVAGTIELLSRSLRPGGLILIGEPYWRQTPPNQVAIEACGATTLDDFKELPDQLTEFSGLGYDVVEMVLADQNSWDRYQGAQWLTMRKWLDANPDDEMAEEVRELLHAEPARYARYTREYVGWGVFVLQQR